MASSRLVKQARRLDHHVGAEVCPRQLRRVALAEHLDRSPAVDDDGVAAQLHGALVGPETESYQQVRERRGVDEASLTPTHSMSALRS